ncbi:MULTISPECIES: hypothetical protein [unclassified Mesorhizobium]|uniref:hypothetical protein n=1 Tax=unclassified Mesorhizobium TaxID=325217 RepID=UPI0024159B43|nr:MULTISPECIES: hypothetical protein [unclassified Mesorhizobium]MDG4901403.1 hypothetical protein [Mesorhizobium sp. WSM4962]MDG4918891.1 hypothetical protein [Mesorhizobium sp. WSM4989]
MPNKDRPIIRLKGRVTVVPDNVTKRQDRMIDANQDPLVEVGVVDALLPCRRFDISYKIAVLDSVSPSLEFLLRLIKTAPGIEEDSAAAFFGYTPTEMAYVINEAITPGYVQRKDGRLWLALAGEQLFKENEQEPLIYSVESRRRSHGFDLLSVAPQPSRGLDSVEFMLPELPIPSQVATGNVADKLSDQFSRFFHELSDRADREQTQRRGLYSIDGIVPRDRFQTPVRIRAFVHASNPHLIEKIDLGSWRPEHEVADRSEIEQSASMLFENTKTSLNALRAGEAYQILIDLAPDFLKEFVVRDGLSVRRYWNEAVRRAGEPRKDRKTIALIGPLSLEKNIARLSAVLEYGLGEHLVKPRHVISVAPHIPYWGGTTLVRDLLNLMRKKMATSEEDGSDLKAVCLAAGKPEKYVEKTYDRMGKSERPEFPAALELLLVPKTMMAAIVHAPIGAATGYPVALGFASFEGSVINRAEALIGDRLAGFDLPEDLFLELQGSLARQQ